MLCRHCPPPLLLLPPLLVAPCAGACVCRCCGLSKPSWLLVGDAVCTDKQVRVGPLQTDAFNRHMLRLGWKQCVGVDRDKGLQSHFSTGVSTTGQLHGPRLRLVTRSQGWTVCDSNTLSVLWCCKQGACWKQQVPVAAVPQRCRPMPANVFPALYMLLPPCADQQRRHLVAAVDEEHQLWTAAWKHWWAGSCYSSCSSKGELGEAPAAEFVGLRTCCSSLR